MNSREEFEKRYPVPSGLHYDKQSNSYIRFVTGLMATSRNLIDYNIRYDVWQAARARPIVLPAYCCELCGGMRAGCVKAIEAAGYKCE